MLQKAKLILPSPSRFFKKKSFPLQKGEFGLLLKKLQAFKVSGFNFGSKRRLSQRTCLSAMQKACLRFHQRKELQAVNCFFLQEQKPFLFKAGLKLFRVSWKEAMNALFFFFFFFESIQPISHATKKSFPTLLSFGDKNRLSEVGIGICFKLGFKLVNGFQ